MSDWKTYYFLNKNGSFVGTGNRKINSSDQSAPKNILKIVDELRKKGGRLYIDSNIGIINIPSKFFTHDDRKFNRYYFAIKPGSPLYIIYKEYSKIIDSPDPLYGGRIEYHNGSLQTFKKLGFYPYLQLITLLKLASAIIRAEIVEIYPIEMRSLWDLESIAWKEYEIKFSYFYGTSNNFKQEVDVNFIAVHYKDPLWSYPLTGLTTIKENINIIEHLRIIEKKQKKSKKYAFLCDMLDNIMEMLDFVNNIDNLINKVREEMEVVPL